MKLEELDASASFALLGPGYGDGQLGLISSLAPSRAAAPGAAQLVFASYESIGAQPRIYSGSCAPCTLESVESTAPQFDIPVDDRGYREAIANIRDSIAAGDVYQVNYTVRAQLPRISGAALAALLCRRGVPEWFAWVRFPEGDEFVSASPEMFFSVDGSRVQCAPMKGTAAPTHEAWLEGSEKDRAELSMITDLMRNDLIPICAPGTVYVTCERRLIHLPYVIQAVSDIEGVLQAGIGPLDVLAALHPGGSITGAPKRAAMQTIARLETTPRGAYCGSLGIIEGDRARFSILIRTAQRNESGWVYGVGGGIVWQSNAALELHEIHLKLGALK